MSEINEFLDGQATCADGKQCPVDASEAFVRGFESQYILEQIATHRSER